MHMRKITDELAMGWRLHIAQTFAFSVYCTPIYLDTLVANIQSLAEDGSREKVILRHKRHKSLIKFDKI